MRGGSEYSVLEILHHKVHRRKELVLKCQGIGETTQLARLMIQFRELDTFGDGVVMCKFTI
jgi:hypothetical protein